MWDCPFCEGIGEVEVKPVPRDPSLRQTAECWDCHGTGVGIGPEPEPEDAPPPPLDLLHC